jgi:hypothetical protein
MNKKDIEEVHTTESKLMMVLVIAVLLLVAGEVVLYRNIQNVKTMISETSIQIKEGRGVLTPTPVQSPTPAAMMEQ